MCAFSAGWFGSGAVFGGSSSSFSPAQTKFIYQQYSEQQNLTSVDSNAVDYENDLKCDCTKSREESVSS
jgi:hypothetical protein